MSRADILILKTIKAGLYLSTITPLLIFNSLLYPFITSKVFFFRILVEIVGGLYVYLAWKYPKYRPRKSAILYSLIIFTVIFIISGIFGVDWNLSFWGDIERMGGIFTWLHFLLYFIILASVLKEEKDWKKLIIFSLGVSALLILYGFGQKFSWPFISYNRGAGRIDGTTGNATFLSSFLILQMFFVWYIYEKNNLKRWTKIILALLLSLQLIAILFTGTRGALLGLLSSLFLVFILSIVLSGGKKKKIIAFGAMSAVLALGIVFFIDNGKYVPRFIMDIPTINRLTVFSLNDSTTNTRLISWEAALRGFMDRPFLGAGPENFAIIFDKYFKASFYSYSPTQTYFDRAHNVVLDILSTGGALGLLAYLSIFAVVIFYAVGAHRKKNISLSSLLFFIAVLNAYFTQNLFVFDSINSSIPWIILSGWAYFVYVNNQADNAAEKNSTRDSRVPSPAIWVLALFCFFVVYAYNIRPMMMVYYAQVAERMIQQEENLAGGVEAYRKALSYGTPIDRDIRTQMANSVSVNIAKYGGGKLSRETINAIFDFAIGEMKKNLSYNSRDNYFNLKLGELYNLWSDYNKKTPIEAEYYLGEAIKASPERVSGYFVLSQSKMLRNDYDGAVRSVREAIAFNPFFRESYWHLFKAYYVAGREEEALKAIKLGFVLGYTLKNENDIEELIGLFDKNKDYKTVILLLKQKINLQQNVLLKPVEPLLYGRLAMAYATIGDNENAREYILKVSEADNSYQAEVNLFLEKLDRGELKK